MLETEVTVGMFRAFVNETRYESRGDVPYRTLIYPRVARSEPDFSWQNAGYSQTDSHPVTIVSWDDAVAFCSWLSQKIGLGVQLPTEAQWEYACRAGSSSAYSWGNVLNGDKANCDGTRPYRTEQSGPFLKEKAPVRSYAPNLWGLYDMHGNVWEWCQDWLGKYPDRSVTDPEGSSTGETRAIRGGSFIDWACESRSASRENWKPGFRTNYLGFRCLAMPQSDDE